MIGCRRIGRRLRRRGIDDLSSHLRFVVILPDGNTRPLICASTPSDVRADHNVRAMVCRWCRVKQPMTTVRKIARSLRSVDGGTRQTKGLTVWM